MSKREILGPAVRAIREAKAQQPATSDNDPARFIGSRFAIACLMSPGHLCNIEKGRKPKTPIETIQRIADQLGVPIEAISYPVYDADALAAA
jgi:transcriptional regulator with XRE-family HTH domain